MHNFLRSAVCLAIGLFVGLLCYAQGANKKAAVPLKAGAKAAGIIFDNGSWEEALKKAAATNRYIFVDAYATWCGPCKLLKTTSFKDPKAAALFNERFINLTIDMEKGAGLKLSELWKIESYPTLIIFDATGRPVLENIGFLNANDLVRFARQALEKK